VANPEQHDNLPHVFATEAADTMIEVDPGQAGEHLEPTLLYMEPYQWTSVAIAVLLLIAFVGMKVHKTIAGGLDNKIKAIRDNLDEAKALRAEAEALRKEYADKIAGAEKDAEAMLENARKEADGIVKKAKEDTAAVIRRRERMAQDKIAAAERQAVDELRARAADASTAAAARLIGANHDAAADKALADEVIGQL